MVFAAHVHDNHHFVLLTGPGPNEDEFEVNDPFYPSTSYPYANISDIITYRVAFNATEMASFPGTAVIPYDMPLYKQCDPRWGNHMMETQTICEVGCLMSSTSMAIGGHNISIDSQISDPDTLNTWLRNNGGYTDGNDLIEAVVPKINASHIQWPSDGMHTSNDIPVDQIRTYLKQKRPVIANVMHGAHFVLVIGWDTSNSDTLYVNDPGFNTISYSYSQDVVGWRLFQMEG